MSRIIIRAKSAGVTRREAFDFLGDLAAGETILTASTVGTLYSGTDPAPAVVSGSAAISGSIVTQLLTGGVLGCVYSLAITITTSLGQTLTKSAYLAIAPEVV